MMLAINFRITVSGVILLYLFIYTLYAEIAYVMDWMRMQRKFINFQFSSAQVSETFFFFAFYR